MEEHNYYIAIDENGTPYIEHGIGDTARGAGQRAAKYLMKIGEGAKARYLYTQQEVQAYMTRAQRAAQAQKNRLEREAAHRRAQMQTQKDRAVEGASNFAKKAGENLKSKSDNMREEFRKKKDEVRNMKLPDLGIAEVGVSARENLKDAKRNYESAKRSGERLQNRASEKMSERGRSAPIQDTKLYKKGADMQKDARKDLERAQNRYDRSLLGRAENAAKKTGQAVKDTAKKAVDTVKDKAGVDERQRAEDAWSKVPKWLSVDDEKGMTALREATKAQDEYRNTPIGRAEYVAERAKEIATGVDGSAKDVAKKAVETVKDKVGVDERERRDAAKKKYEDNQKKVEELSKKTEQAAKPYKEFDDEMFEKYGVNYVDKMTANEKSKYDKLEKAWRDAADEQHDAWKQQYSKAWGEYEDTLKDEYDKAQTAYDNTPLGTVDYYKKKIRNRK